MSVRTQQGIAVVAAALGFGVAADILARTVPGRLDVALGLGALVLVAGCFVHRGLLPAPRGLAHLGLPLALLLVALIWRDSATLFALNLLAIGLLAALASPRVRAVGLRRSGLGDYARGALQLAGGAAAGAAPLLLTEIEWRSLPADGPMHRLRGTLVGLLAAVPIAALFGGLLMDADPVFDRLMTAALTSESDRLLRHALAILAWGWVAAGTLRLLLLRQEERPATAAGGRERFSLLEVGTVLAVVDLLFLAFVAVQFRYLFGGADLVRGVIGLSYSEYARQGFFQLVAVAALSLPLLLAADWVLGRRTPATLRRFRLLASLMLLLLNVMLASALWRMRLYTAEYGLTELRLYTTAFMGWLVVVLGWFAATVLRGRRSRFGSGALGAALLVLAALNLVNPDGLIASTNLRRAGTLRPVDAAYLSGLSADAIPAIRRLLPALAPEHRCVLGSTLAARWVVELERRSRWNISISRAAREPRPLAGECGA